MADCTCGGRFGPDGNGHLNSCNLVHAAYRGERDASGPEHAAPRNAPGTYWERRPDGTETLRTLQPAVTNEITQADREMLAAEYEKMGCTFFAAGLKEGGAWLDAADTAALRAIAAARRQGQQPGERSYSLDADPDGIRERVASAITGALAFGAQGNNIPPEGHWLAPFWEMARAERTQQPNTHEAVALRWRVRDTGDTWIPARLDRLDRTACPRPELIEVELLFPAAQEGMVPEGWMRDVQEVTGLAEHLEKVAWRANERGDVDCYDQGCAMAAEVVRKILLPMLATAGEGGA